MKERPIIFNGEMVRAILSGDKTQTRRILKPQPELYGTKSWERGHWAFNVSEGSWEHVVPVQDGTYMANSGFVNCPHGVPGDHLWVRETFSQRQSYVPGQISPQTPEIYHYWADGYPDPKYNWTAKSPSTHMTRRMSRITLEITNIRVERLQDISEDDVLSEGAGLASWVNDGRTGEPLGPQTAGFAQLWDSINAKRGFGWDKKPWVWVIEFRRI